MSIVCRVLAVSALLLGSAARAEIVQVAPTFGSAVVSAAAGSRALLALAGEPLVGVSVAPPRSLAAGFIAFTESRLPPLAVDPGADGRGTRWEGLAPNPFVSATRLRFSLAEPSAVDVVVFDASGRRIRTLAQGVWAGGRHDLFWGGETDQGRTSPPGLYLVRAVFGSHRETHRVVRVR